MRHAVDRPSGLYRSRNAVHATFEVTRGPRVSLEGTRGPRVPKRTAAWTSALVRAAVVGKGTCHLLHEGGPRPVQRGARNCAIWAMISVGKRLEHTFRHAVNTNDHHSCGQSVECVTDR